MLEPGCLLRKLWNPNLVSYRLMANLARATRRKLITDIDAIVDVGANIGQYAYMAHSIWPRTPIFSFEPDPECYTQLCETFTRHGIPGECFQLAVGESHEEKTFRLQTNSAQSSFLTLKTVPGGFWREIKVQATTLSDIAPRLPNIRQGLLKVDTQGYELAVLSGAKAFLRSCAYVQLEVSFRPAYEGQPYVADLLTAMRELGFICIEILDVLRDGQLPAHPIAEADLLFARAD